MYSRSNNIQKCTAPLFFRAIGLSYFASGMGAWVVYGSTEMGANPDLSWLGVIGYASASALPALIICVVGPRIRGITGEKAFCATDFGLARYGRLMQFSIAVIGVFYSECVSYAICSHVPELTNFCFVLTPYPALLNLYSVYLHGFRNDLHIQRVWSRCWT